ncbi:MAG: DUF3320 domain-containing protein, partial [Clostridia bacterium]|nr:DUF3320 domain-containing protein [Clostridia bacterium]
DIGVVDPENENRYLLGVIIDSYTYEGATTSRDRNVIQPSVLRSLNWNLMRIWSFDYYDNPEKVINEIVAQIEDIKANPDAYAVKEEEPQHVEIEFESKAAEKVNYSKPYVVYDEVHSVSASSDYKYYAECMEIVKDIMSLEAPISADVLYNRFANAIGLTRSGTRTRETVIRSLERIGAKKSYNLKKTKEFFWLNGQSVNMTNYRVGGLKPRDMDDVPKEEIFVAIKEALTNHGAISISELKSCVAECFGIKAVRNKVSEAIDDALEFYIRRDVLVMIDAGTRVALRED